MVQEAAYIELKTIKENRRVSRRKIYIVDVEISSGTRDLKRWAESVCQYSNVWIIRRPI